MSSNEERKKIKKFGFYRFIVLAISLAVIAFILSVAPNYIKSDIANKTNLVINNNNVTKKLKNDVLVEDNVVYLSQEDIENYFDGNIYYDSKYDQIITTSNTKVAVIPIGKKQITLNGSSVKIYAEAVKKNNKYYLPFSEICKSVYDVETTYVKNSDTVIITSLDRELTYANSSKKNSVKYKPTIFSKTIEKISIGDNVTVVSTEKGWTKITTQNGKVGYVKENTLVNSQKVRDNFTIEKQIEGNVSIAWDYFSEYAKAPARKEKIEGVNVVSPSFISLKKQGQGEISENIGTQGIDYVTWAHNNGYKVWALASNNSMKESTSEVLSDYKLREKLIDNLINSAIQYNLDGINLDFENIYKADKDNYSRLVIELAPRLKELGKVLSVDVTAPDGSDDWSLCFDRNKIAGAADYIVFMAYDQNGISSAEAGTTAGYDWVETNINKFLKQENVNLSKLILGIPFYTRIWKISGDTTKSEIVSMKDTYSKIPSNTNIQWLDDLKQNYAEYTQSDITYKIWIEDTKSITEKLNLINKYNLSGASFWEKDRESEDIWNVVSSKLNVK